MNVEVRILSLVCGIGAAFSLCALPAIASAADSLVSPALNAKMTTDTTVVTPTTRQIVTHVELKAGPRRVAVELEAASPTFRRLDFGRFVTEGGTLRPLRIQPTRPLSFESIVFSGSGTGETADCAFVGDDLLVPHGGAFVKGVSLGLLLEPHQEIGFDIPFDIAADTPWFGTNYAPIVRLVPIPKRIGGERILPNGVRTLKHRVTMSTLPPLVIGPFAARIDLDAVKGTRPAVVTGALVPAEPGRTVTLSVSRLSYRRSYAKRTVGSATTAADGSFRIDSWRPAKNRIYALQLNYPEQPGTLGADSMCGTMYPDQRADLAP